jgi:hypothetical protein
MKGQPQSVYLSEAGMYKLVTKSKMKKAEIFSDWITEEVLPSIRKYGVYKLKKNAEKERTELLKKIDFMEKELKVLKNEMKKDKYPEGGYVYALDFSTDDQEVFRIGKTEKINSRTDSYTTHNLNKKKYIVLEKTDCPIKLEYCVRGMLYPYRYKDKKDFYVCSEKIVKKAFRECKKTIECMNQKGGSKFSDNVLKADNKKIKKLNKQIEKYDKILKQ